MASQCVGAGHHFDPAETNTNNWAARLFKEAWLTDKNPLNQWTELQQAFSVLGALIE